MKVRVRMYNAGFGDCFLLTFPAPDRPRKVLIDCGKHALSRTGPALGRIVEKVLEDVEEPAGRRVDVIVATHRHQDHVQGFAAAGWGDVQVDEVWMPWTEHPTDPVARDICDRQSARADRAHRDMTASPGFADREYLLGYASNNLKNAAAMNRLHDGFQETTVRRFLPEAQEEKNRFRTSALPGVEVYALGPPRDPEVLREMEPPPEESFLRAWEPGVRPAGEWPSPFADRFLLDRAGYEERSAWRSLEADFPQASEEHVGRVFEEPALELLSRLEAAVNSTSLVLLFHVGNAWMLFPGDAQWGTWNGILRHPLHSRLLERLTFYKVGHHGSHNSTPISFVEKYVNDGLQVMLPYGRVDKWPSIPRAGLLDALALRKVAVARSDQAPATPGPFTAHEEDGEVLFIDAEVPV